MAIENGQLEAVCECLLWPFSHIAITTPNINTLASTLYKHMLFFRSLADKIDLSCVNYPGMTESHVSATRLTPNND